MVVGFGLKLLSHDTLIMPKVLSYTPPWLSRPSPGAAVFASTSTQTATSERNGKKGSEYIGPTRTLAKRGNEVFVVVDNQIRWCSLTRLKDEWKQQSNMKRGHSKQEGSEEQGLKNSREDVEGAPYRVSVSAPPDCVGIVELTVST